MAPNWFRRKQILESEFDRELRFHIDKLTQENIDAGMSAGEARRQAMLEFGGKEQMTEELREVHTIPFLETALANLKFALRLVRKAPALSLAIVLTLALGIGANSAVFSAIDAVLLRPLPFPHGDELVMVRQSPWSLVAPTRLEDWNRMNSTFQALAGYYVENESETSGAVPEKLTQAFVAPRFLQVWGVAPALGRDFTPAESLFGGPAAVLISDRLWHKRFDADHNVVGKSLHFGYAIPGHRPAAYTIVGVLPAAFLFPNRDVDLWSPVPTNAPYAQDRGSTWYTIIGRLKPSVSADQANANLNQVLEYQGPAGSSLPALSLLSQVPMIAKFL